MKIYFATVFDSRNVHRWSGLGYYMGKMLEDQGHEVIYLNNLQLKHAFLHKIRKRILEKFFKRSFSPNFDMSVSRKYADEIRQRVPEGSIIFSPNTILLAGIGDKYITVLFTDSTFRLLVNFYPSYTRISSGYLAQGNRIESDAITHANLLIYSSNWAAASARADYGADPAKIHVVPFGTNMNSSLDPTEVPEVITNRIQSPVVDLLFIGVSWYRKGGNDALAVVHLLNKMGIPARLHIVGIRSLPANVNKAHTVFHGYISKSSPEGLARLTALFRTCRFLLLPSRADCTPVVVSEASSFALPTLISDVGGNSEVVLDGLNGMVFNFDTELTQCVEQIRNLLRDDAKYSLLCTSSYDMFRTRLNWKSSGDTITRLLHQIQGK